MIKMSQMSGLMCGFLTILSNAYILRAEFANAKRFESRFFVRSLFPLIFYLIFYDYDSLWVWSDIEYVGKFAWNGFCIVNTATCKTCAIILVAIATKRKPQNTELSSINNIFNRNENRMAANNGCCAWACVSRRMCRFLMMDIKVYQCSFTWLCRTTKHFHFIPYWRWKCDIFWFFR